MYVPYTFDCEHTVIPSVGEASITGSHKQGNLSACKWVAYMSSANLCISIYAATIPSHIEGVHRLSRRDPQLRYYLTRSIVYSQSAISTSPQSALNIVSRVCKMSLMQLRVIALIASTSNDDRYFDNTDPQATDQLEDQLKSFTHDSSETFASSELET